MPNVVTVFPSTRDDQDLEAETLASSLRGRGWTVRIGRKHSCESSQLWYHHFRVATDRQSFVDRTKALTEPSPIQVAGGFLASCNDKALLKALPRLDAVIRGDPERRLDHLLRQTNSRLVPRLEGLTVRDAQGRAQRVPSRGPDPGLSLPTAAADLFDESRLRTEQKVLLSRGCFDDCKYCGYQHAQGAGVAERWRSRPPRDVVREIEHYYQLGARRFTFQAHVFFGYDEQGTNTIAEICREILDRKLDMGFRFVTHPHHLLRNRNLLPLLLEAGLEHVYLGIDSGSPAALERYRVSFTTEDGVEALRLLHRYRVNLTPAFIFYDPLATWPEMKEQLSFLRRIAPFFGHRDRTYATILEKELLNRYFDAYDHTPLSRQLEASGVVIDKPPGERYVLRFADPQVASFHGLHRRITRELLAPLRPLTWRSASVAAYPHLSLLPLDLLDRVAQRIEDDRADASETTEDLTNWLAERLAPDFETMRDLVDWPKETPQTLRDLLPAGAI